MVQICNKGGSEGIQASMCGKERREIVKRVNNKQWSMADSAKASLVEGQTVSGRGIKE